MPRILFLCALTLFLSIPLQVWSISSRDEELALAQIYGGEEMVSIASGYRQSLSQAPSTATVMTAAEIRDMGATTLDQVLERIPGLHVARSQLRLDAVYTLRGFSSTFSPGMLMMINGVGIDSLFFGSRFASFRLPVNTIERVEVIRGPGSAIYGADAFVGVINIVTKGAAAINGDEVGVRGGSFDTLDLWAQHGGRLFDNLDLAISTEWQSTKGDRGRRVSSDMQSILDRWYGTAASNAPGSLDTEYGLLDTRIELGQEDWTLRLWNWHLDNGGYGPGVSQALNDTTHHNSDIYTVDFNYATRPAPEWNLELHTSYLQYDGDYFMEALPPGTMVPIGDDGNLFTPGGGVTTFTDGVLIDLNAVERHYALEASAVYSGLNQHLLRFASGTSYKEFDTREAVNYGPGVLDGSNFQPVADGSLTDLTGTPYVWAPNVSRRLNYLALQDEWTFARDWATTIGARFDHYSDFGETVNPRLALIWQARYDLTTKLLYGRAFRPPALVELYTQNNPVQIGNPELDPETIDTYELVFDYHPPTPWRLSLNLYRYRAKNLIRFEPDGLGNSIAQNAGEQRGYGFELDGAWTVIPDLQLGANLGWVQAEDKATGERVAEVPACQAKLWSTWHPTRYWTQYTQATYIGDRQRITDDRRKRIDDYILVDLNLRYHRPTQNWEAALLVRNLFDSDAREPSPGDPGLPGGAAIPEDYPLEGRSLMLEFRYRI